MKCWRWMALFKLDGSRLMRTSPSALPTTNILLTHSVGSTTGALIFSATIWSSLSNTRFSKVKGRRPAAETTASTWAAPVASRISCSIGSLPIPLNTSENSFTKGGWFCCCATLTVWTLLISLHAEKPKWPVDPARSQLEIWGHKLLLCAQDGLC